MDAARGRGVSTSSRFTNTALNFLPLIDADEELSPFCESSTSRSTGAVLCSTIDTLDTESCVVFLLRVRVSRVLVLCDDLAVAVKFFGALGRFLGTSSDIGSSLVTAVDSAIPPRLVIAVVIRNDAACFAERLGRFDEEAEGADCALATLGILGTDVFFGGADEEGAAFPFTKPFAGCACATGFETTGLETPLLDEEKLTSNWAACMSPSLSREELESMGSSRSSSELSEVRGEDRADTVSISLKSSFPCRLSLLQKSSITIFSGTR